MKKNSILLVVLFFCCKFTQAQLAADSMLHFIKNNKENSSLYLLKNDSVWAKLNEHKRMPLASTVKILVAIEFAKQVGANLLHENSPVALADLNKYYLPFTDAGAHEKWLQYEKKLNHISKDSIALLNVAKGMMMFSSNANTEYLMDLLGLDNIKNNLQLMGITEHTPVYYLVSSLFMYQNPRKIKEAKVLKAIKSLNEEQYARYIYDMHKALAYDTVLKQKFNLADLTQPMQKLWSDRLPASNSFSYVQLAHILNNRKYFSEEMYRCLEKILETVMENPNNKTWLLHAGMKGGSTPWVLTKTLYATLKDSTKIELAYFFNNLNPNQNNRLQLWMNDFEYQLLSNPVFRDRVKASFP